jgi:hypothetical protein
MLTIKNIEDIKSKEFHFSDTWWMLYGVDVNNIEYRFMFIPMEAGRYDTQKMRLVILDRKKKRRGNNVLGYRLWTTDGKHTYLNTNDIPLWTRLVEIVYKNQLIYANN